jgi:hypothetical protein
MVDNLLPDSRLKSPKGEVFHKGLNWEPIFCANCGVMGAYTPKGNWAFWLCNPCAENWVPLANTLLVPDEVFWEKVNQAQMEEYGHILTQEEVAKELSNPTSVMSLLKKEGR